MVKERGCINGVIQPLSFIMVMDYMISIAFAKWVTVPGSASQKNSRYTNNKVIIAANQKKQRAQYLAVDCFASICYKFWQR